MSLRLQLLLRRRRQSGCSPMPQGRRVLRIQQSFLAVLPPLWARQSFPRVWRRLFALFLLRLLLPKISACCRQRRLQATVCRAIACTICLVPLFDLRPRQRAVGGIVRARSRQKILRVPVRPRGRADMLKSCKPRQWKEDFLPWLRLCGLRSRLRRRL